jgi:hypothetical protein
MTYVVDAAPVCSVGLRAGAVFAIAASLLGCPSPNTYGTPRTVAPGEISHTVAVEGIHVADSNMTLPTLPTVQLRVGLADRVDLGVRVSNLSSVGADVKWNFVRSRSFDLAVDPGLQAGLFPVPSSSARDSLLFIAYGHVPLIAGINFSESASLVVSGGAIFASAGRGSSSNDAGSGARAGIGLNLRPSKKFAIQPEITALRFFNETPGLVVVFGVGFNFGALPSYAPGSEDGAAEEE